MIIKEITVRKSNKNTIKQSDGSYVSHEADIALTVSAEEGKVNEMEVIDRVKQLVEITLKDDVDWVDSERKEVKNT